MMTDNPDPITVPQEIRRRAFLAAEDALDGVLREAGYYLDLFGRLEMIELGLADAAASLGVDGPDPVVN
jgi:hypothetical protein